MIITNIKVRFEKLVKTFRYENETFSMELSASISEKENAPALFNHIQAALYAECKENVMAQIKKIKAEEGW